MNIVSKGNYHHETQAKRNSYIYSHLWRVFLGFKVRGNNDEEEEKIKSGNMSKGHILVPTSWPQGLI